MKQLSIKLLILSRSRSNSIQKKTLSVFPEWIEVLVPESERADYESKIVNPILTVPDSVEGLGSLRNWVLDNFSEETVVMIDDDIDKMYCLSGKLSRALTDPAEVVQVIINDAVMSRDAGLHVFGFFQSDIRKYNGTSPFALTGWVGCVIGINGRKFRFRDDYFKVDIDMCLQAMMVDRIIWIDNRYRFAQSLDNNMGGNAKFRTQELFEKSTESLLQKWGQYLRISDRHKAQIRLTTAVKRRQEVKYE